MILAKNVYVLPYFKNCILTILQAEAAAIYCEYEQLRLCTKGHGESAVIQLSAFARSPQLALTIASEDLDLRRGKE